MLSTGTGKRSGALEGPSNRSGTFGESGGALSSLLGGRVDRLLGDRLDGPLDYGAIVGGDALKRLKSARGRILERLDRVPLEFDRHGARLAGGVAMVGSWS